MEGDRDEIEKERSGNKGEKKKIEIEREEFEEKNEI